MMIHNLKSKPEYFHAVWDNKKTFEIRNNDRNFEVGDFLILQEWAQVDSHPWQLRSVYDDPKFGHSGGIILARVTYVTNFEQKEGYVVLGMEILDRRDLRAYNKCEPVMFSAHT